MLYTLTALLSLVSLSLGATFEVQVGMDGSGQLATVFTPNQVTAQVGDRVEFVFRGKNHTVTQSSFAQPCTQQFNTAVSVPGVDSGFMAITPGSTNLPVFTIQVMDTTPQWFFCNQGNHCNSGMVFAINAAATGDKSFDKWVELARTASHPDPALRQTAAFTPEAGQGGANVAPENNNNNNNNENNNNNNNLGASSSIGSESSFSFGSGASATGTTFGAGFGSGLGSGSGLGASTSATVFVGSIPATATAPANAVASASTSSAGLRMEVRNVLGMAILGAISFAMAW